MCLYVVLVHVRATEFHLTVHQVVVNTTYRHSHQASMRHSQGQSLVGLHGYYMAMGKNPKSNHH